MDVTRAKINLREGIVELEGSEEFVKKYLDEFKTQINKAPVQSSFPIAQQLTHMEQSPKGPKNSGSKPSARGISLAPIPLDLKTKTPSLREFFSKKKPLSNQEITTLFVYYLNKTAGIQEVLPGHILSCFNEIGNIKKPLNIPQLFRDITHLKGWLTPNGNGSVRISIAGENFVEHDLPKPQQDVKPSQIPAK